MTGNKPKHMIVFDESASVERKDWDALNYKSKYTRQELIIECKKWLRLAETKEQQDFVSALLGELETKFCAWKLDENYAWDTSCGNTFILSDGTPKENGMSYCCYCGKRLCGYSGFLDEKS